MSDLLQPLTDPQAFHAAQAKKNPFVLAQKTAPVMRSTIHQPKEHIMAETTETTAVDVAQDAAEVVEQKTNRVKRFFQEHPRLTKVGATTGAALAIIGATSVAKNMQHNRSELADARENLSEAGSAVIESTKTPPADNAEA